MNRFNNSVAVVTGAGSGIGRQLAIQLARAGANLALADITPDQLKETADLISQTSSVRVFTKVFDVADQAAVYDFAEEVKNEYGEINLLINNAGVALGSGPLWTTSVDDFKWLMGINFYGVLSGTKAFFPLLEKASWGHIVNISSIFGIISVPTQAAYNASKFAVRGMTDALRQELEIAGSSISCTTVHPGGIKTNIARSGRFVDDGSSASLEKRDEAIANFDKLARTTAETAAEKILYAVVKNKRRLLIGADAKLMDILQRLFPIHYGAILKRVLGSSVEF